MRRTAAILTAAALALAAWSLRPAPASPAFEAIPPTLAQYPGQLTASVYHASRIPGVKLDCVLDTGLNPSGGAPTDNAARINAVLATATASRPVRLVVDGGCAIGAPIVIPPTGHVTIVGLGWDTGFHVLPGSNCNAIQNFPDTDYATAYAWAGLSGWANTATDTHPGVTGKNVTVSNLRVNGNRGTYPGGNSNGHRDGTVTQADAVASTPDARGPYTVGYWLSGIILSHVENVHIDRVFVYDAPAYHVNLYDCQYVWIDRCRVQAGDPTFSGNTDGVHLNGGCTHVWITNYYASTGDDAIGFNVNEGNGQPGGHLFVDDAEFENCQSGLRVDGASTATSQVVASNVRGTCRYFAFMLGDSGTTNSGTDTNHSVTLDNWAVNLTTTSYGSNLFWLCANAGDVAITRCLASEPAIAGPFVTIGSGSTTPTIASLRLDATLRRSDAGNAAMPAVTWTAGSVGTLHLSYRAHDRAGSAYGAVANLINFSAGSLGRLWVADVDPTHVTALTNAPGSIAAKAGPGLAASGF